MDTAPPPDRDAALDQVAADLGNGWPHYWSVRHRSKAELLEDRPAKGPYPAGPLALQLATLGVRLIADARRGIVAAAPDLAAAGAAALLLSLAEDYYLFLGSFSMYDDPALFNRYTVGEAPQRDLAEAFARDVGVADWCADAGHPLVDAGGAVIRLEPDHIPAPTIETPQFFGVISRMRGDARAPDDDRMQVYRTTAAALRDAVATYRDDITPAVLDGRRPANISTSIVEGLLIVRRAMAEATRAAARDDGDDADTTAVTALRFLYQDMLMVETMPPERYNDLPLLTSEEFADIADEDSEIGAWIDAHDPR